MKEKLALFPEINGDPQNQWLICDNKTKSILKQKIQAVFNSLLISGKLVVKALLISLAAIRLDSEEVLS